MSLVARLIDLVAEVVGPPDSKADVEQDGDERLAVAALLVHVARVDGTVAEAERRSLLDLLAGRFGLSEAGARSLASRGDRLDRETDDIVELIEMLGHGMDETAKSDLLGLAYRIAAADGGVTEFEEDLVWRVGQLLGLGDDAIAAARAAAIPDA